MSTTVSYKGSTIATLSNETKTLTTAGTWVEGDIVVTDSGSGTAAISVVDTTDSHGGTIREITALDISDTTAVAGDVASGKYFYTASGVKTLGTSTGGGSVTITDEANSTGITCVIVTSQTPTPTPVETWETIFEGNKDVNSNGDGVTGYCWINSLDDIDISDGSEWRITVDDVTYIETATYSSTVQKIAIPWGEGDDITILFFQQSDAWVAYVTDRDSGTLSIKIERLVEET